MKRKIVETEILAYNAMLLLVASVISGMFVTMFGKPYISAFVLIAILVHSMVVWEQGYHHYINTKDKRISIPMWIYIVRGIYYIISLINIITMLLHIVVPVTNNCFQTVIEYMNLISTIIIFILAIIITNNSKTKSI